MVWEINMGVCPRLEFDNTCSMFVNCLGYEYYIYGAFELCFPYYKLEKEKKYSLILSVMILI